MAKTRSDSILKNLTPERQEQVIDWCDEPKTETCVGSYEFAREQLAADGIKTSKRALSEFYSWWHLQWDFQVADGEAAEMEDLLKSLNLGLTVEQIEAAGQLVFTKRALTDRDSEEFREMQYLRLAKETARTKAAQEAQKIEIRQQAETRAAEKFKFEREKFELEAAEKMLSAALRAKADEINASSMTNAAKIAAMRQAAFAEIDALQASGAVVIPK